MIQSDGNYRRTLYWSTKQYANGTTRLLSLLTCGCKVVTLKKKVSFLSSPEHEVVMLSKKGVVYLSNLDTDTITTSVEHRRSDIVGHISQPSAYEYQNI